MYDIWMRCYPQRDVNMSEEWELEPMTLKTANRMIADMEQEYLDDGRKGHPMYKAKFYPMETER